MREPATKGCNRYPLRLLAESGPLLMTADSVTVVVVLGAAVWPSGKPSPALRRRTLHGGQFILTQQAGKIIVSGGVGEHPPSEAMVMRSLLVAQGVSERDIILDENSLTTFDSAVRVKALMQAHGLRQAIIVTETFHIFRGLLAFRGLGIRASGRCPPVKFGEIPLRKLAWYYLRELAAIPWYLVRLARHYLG